MKKNKPEKMIKFRHKFFEGVLSFVFSFYSKIAYNYHKEKMNLPKGPALILSNHVCTFDPAFVGYPFKLPVYFVGMEDLLSRKGSGAFLKWAFNIIPKAKAQSDPRAVKMIMKTIKEGGRVILFPSGNRTYDGGATHIDPSIGKLCKTLKVPIVLMNILGGYGSDPRWAKKIRRGKVTVVNKDTITPEELESLEPQEIYERIVNALDVKEDNTVLFKSNRKAEYLERLLFLCPDCGELNTLSSHKNNFKCNKCGYEVEYQEDLTFKLLNGNKYVKDVREWHIIQKDYVSNLDFSKDYLIFEENNVGLYRIYPSKKKDKFLPNATFKCFTNRIEVSNESNSFAIPFDSATNVAAVGKHKANFVIDGDTYQIDGDERCNAYKYVMMYYHYKNTISGSTGKDEYFGI